MGRIVKGRTVVGVSRGPSRLPNRSGEREIRLWEGCDQVLARHVS